jgi:hypothetical protein
MVKEICYGVRSSKINKYKKLRTLNIYRKTLFLCYVFKCSRVKEQKRKDPKQEINSLPNFKTQSNLSIEKLA